MDPLKSPVWHALCTEQAGIAVARGKARRYAQDFIPWAAVERVDDEAAADLWELLAPGERILVEAEKPLTGPGLEEVSTFSGFQMLFEGVPEEKAEGTEVLHKQDVPAMLALAAIAPLPLFGPGAPSLGTFYGIRQGSELVAMAGERFVLTGYVEISGVCTHPGHRKRGYAAKLIDQLLLLHRQRGVQSFLHVAAGNPAMALYRHMGFVVTRESVIRAVQRTA